MERFCRLTTIGIVARGDFLELRIEPLGKVVLSRAALFLDATALRLMNQYESQPIADTLEIDVTLLETPERTRAFYRRLFDDGQYTADFITVASETIGLWIEERLERVLFAKAGRPHNNDPAYDVLSLYEEDDQVRLRVVQIKATQDNLQGNCSDAIARFERLEAGDYDAELSATLDLIVGQRRAPEGLIVRNLKLNRRYRLTAVHAQDRGVISLMTTFNEKVRGGTVRRSSVFMQVEWPDFWDEIARRVYARLA